MANKKLRVLCYNYIFKTQALVTNTLLMLLFLIIQGCSSNTHSPIEQLGRGVVAIRKSHSEVVVSWRYLPTDPISTKFTIFRGDTKIGTTSSTQGTFIVDNYSANKAVEYRVMASKGSQIKEGRYTLPANAPIGYIDIPMDVPADGITPAGDSYTYSSNDASIGDMDGDGEYEIVVKWNPSNAKDNAHDGYTGNVYVDCYRLTGEKLWRIDLGKNIRAGAHYTQFMVYDLNGDSRSEVVMKTSDGTIDGCGKIIGDQTADYRETGISSRNQGRILTGSEYLTIFNGLTGAEMQTIEYNPQRGNLEDWGDNRANRSDRFLAAVAHLGGTHASVVMCRGYYTRSVLAAYDWDGTNLIERWVFDSNKPENKKYAGQGNHNLRVGDVDGDGFDEIVYGQCAIDHDGNGLYTTGLNHGDAIHLTKFAPELEGLQVLGCHENRKDGTTYRDAATGEILQQVKSSRDVGRCMAADIDPTNRGLEMWSWQSNGIFNIKGEVVNPEFNTLSVNMAVWWDGDFLRELLDKTEVTKYDWKAGMAKQITLFEGCQSNNGTKANPALQGDIVGDWREEVLIRTTDSKSLRLYVSPIATEYRFHTFLLDPVYRVSIATQNVAYNQPTQPGFYFGSDLEEGIFRGYEIDTNIEY